MQQDASTVLVSTVALIASTKTKQAQH